MNENEILNTQTGELERVPVIVDSNWKNMVNAAQSAKIARDNLVASVMVRDVHYGVIPGIKKPTLFKAGAEVICDAFNLYPEYETLDKLENWEGRFWFYRYKAVIRRRENGMVVATGVGSCNSKEDKYRWRQGERLCPACKQPAIIRSADFRTRQPNGWLCFSKKGGCGAKYPIGDMGIEGQVIGRVENDDIESLVNTIDKMAQKRAHIAATLGFGFSNHFTQDVEDNPKAFATPGTSPLPAIKQEEKK